MADLDIPDHVYNWLVSYFRGRSHCTRHGEESSALLEISAGIIQGSGIGPASYVVNSSDLAALTPGNFLCKYADDTYIIIPSDNVSEELANVDTWAQANNLTLNRAKSQETVFTDKRRKPRFQQPPPIANISRVDVIKILGVTVTNTLSVREHVSNVISACSQSVHALQILRTHGMTAASVHITFKSVVVAKLVYAASSCGASRRATTEND